MESIIDILHKGGYSCVMKNREEVRTFTQRGVADLYDLYQADSAFMKGAAIADKVIGKGAAALMVLGGFKTVYADIISTPLRWHCCAKQELKRLLPKRFPISLTVTRPAGARWRRLAWS